MPRSRVPNIFLPDIIIDPETRTRYQRRDFLGQGAFGRCYKLQNMETREYFAGKIVSKKLLMYDIHKEKMSQEIAIHRTLNHENIVGFHTYFEDRHNIYIILELCEKKSLMELNKRRPTITELEVLYYMQQIARAVRYLHRRNIIHRDLKIGNLFINKNMKVKVGDFGLATQVEFENQKNTSFCGTPNYIAPEILLKTGYSFEVDLWSIGCVMYTLLCGRPPFHMNSLKETYEQIKRCEYKIPSFVSDPARKLLSSLLQADPKKRPSIDAVLTDEFMKGYAPRVLPSSCLTMAPRRDTLANISRLPLQERLTLVEVNTDTAAKNRLPAKTSTVPSRNEPQRDLSSEQNYLLDLYEQLKEVIKSCPTKRDDVQEDEAEDPQLMPMFWISKWVDYSDKYGLGYYLSDDSKGVQFNDGTNLIMLSSEQNLHYIENNQEHFYTIEDYPRTLKKKVALLRHFISYMQKRLLKTGAKYEAWEEDELCRLPYLKHWFRTRSGIVMYLTNGTLQINFFEDHAKVILCPLVGAVTYIDPAGDWRTFKLSDIKKHGCSEALFSRISYAQNVVERFLNGKIWW